MHHFLPHVPWYKYKKVWKLGNGIFTKQQIPERSVVAKPDFDFKDRLIGRKKSEVLEIKVRVREVLDVAKGIKSFHFEASDSDDSLPPFTAGSHINIKLPSGKIRSYSLVNSQHEQGQYQIAVKKEESGKGGSIEMHEGVMEGMELSVSFPKNNFVLYENVKRYILISGGIGITPLLSMAHRLDELDKHFEFHICSKSEDDIPFRYELKNWSFAPNIEIHLDKDDKSSIELFKVLSDPNDETLIYCCGPSGFNKWVKSMAKELEWNTSQIKQELFTSEAIEVSELKPFEV